MKQLIIGMCLALNGIFTFVHADFEYRIEIDDTITITNYTSSDGQFYRIALP